MRTEAPPDRPPSDGTSPDVEGNTDAKGDDGLATQLSTMDWEELQLAYQQAMEMRSELEESIASEFNNLSGVRVNAWYQSTMCPFQCHKQIFSAWSETIPQHESWKSSKR